MPTQLSLRLRALIDNNYYGQTMKLRFKVNQGEALRQGVDAPTSIVTIQVNPKQLTQEERNLLADRMEGIDVRELSMNHFTQQVGITIDHITANLPTFEALMTAIRTNEAKARHQQGAHAPKRAEKGKPKSDGANPQVPTNDAKE
jgi:hypothetical protein